MSQILHTLWASFQFIPVRLSGSPQPASLPSPSPRPPNYPRAGERKRGKSSQVYFSFTPIFFTFGSPAQARGTWLEVRFALEVSLSQLELRRGKYTATDKTTHLQLCKKSTQSQPARQEEVAYSKDRKSRLRRGRSGSETANAEEGSSPAGAPENPAPGMEPEAGWGRIFLPEVVKRKLLSVGSLGDRCAGNLKRGTEASLRRSRAV